MLENRGEWIQVGGRGEGLQRNESSVGLATEVISLWGKKRSLDTRERKILSRLLCAADCERPFRK